MIGHINSAAFIWSKWMVHMFWQVSLLIILVMLIDMAIRRRAWPHIRYVLWGLVFLKLLIPPAWQMPTSIVSLIQPKVSERIPAEYTLWYEESTLTSGITEPPQDQVAESVTIEKATWQTVLFLTWIAGMLFFVLMLAIQMSRLPKRSQKQSTRDAPEWFGAALDSISTRLHLKKGPSVIFSRDAGSPAVYGLFRPTLVLPRGYFDHLTREQAEHVLLHELSHIKRGDLWVHWFCILLQIVYWINPLLILARRQLGHVSEICCDLSVAYVLKEKTADYRETLLNTSQRLLADAVIPSIGLLGIFEEPLRIVARLKWLEKNTWENRKRKTAVSIFAALVMIIFVMPMNGLSQSAAPNENFQAQPGAPAEVETGQIQMTNAPSPQILIEAMILEVAGDTDFDIGCQEEEERNRYEMPFAICDSISIEGEFYPDIETASEALSNMPGVKILAMPKIVALNNKTAILKQGAQVRYPPGSANTADLGLLLEITPQLKEDGLIRLNIHQEVTQMVDGRIVPREIETTSVIEEGMTMAISLPPSSDPAASVPDGKSNWLIGESNWLILLLTCSENPDGSVPYDSPFPQAERTPEKYANGSESPGAGDVRWRVGVQMPAPPPESEELREIPHHFEPNFAPESNQKVDTPPTPQGFPPPQYPLDAARDKIEGRVVLKFVVDTDGKVKNPEVVEADPEGLFEQSALTNIKQFKFKPATLDGKPVPCMENYTLGFKLD